MKQIIAFICLLLFVKLVPCQPVTPAAKDFVLVNNQVWVLQDAGIKVFDIETGQQIYKNLRDKAASTIAKDNNENIVVDQDRHIKILDIKSLQWRTIGSYAQDLHLFKILFDKQNKCFLLTDVGVLDLKTGKSWFPESEPDLVEKSTIAKRWSISGFDPQSLIDGYDNIWIYRYLGEWGSEMFVFNLKLKRFIKPLGDFYRGDLFMGDQHVFCFGFGAFSSFDITPIGRQGYQIIGHRFYNASDNKGDLLSAKGAFPPAGYHIGMGAFNPSDRNIYFICDFGLYKGDPNKSLKTIDCWTRVNSFHLQPQNIKPRRHSYETLGSLDTTKWIDLQEDYDTTMPYAITKMEFTKNGKLVFTSLHDGLGVFDGKKITILDPSSSF